MDNLSAKGVLPLAVNVIGVLSGAEELDRESKELLGILPFTSLVYILYGSVLLINCDVFRYSGVSSWRI